VSEIVRDICAELDKESLGSVERDLLILRGLSRLEPLFKDLLSEMRFLLQEARNGTPWFKPGTEAKPLLEPEP